MGRGLDSGTGPRGGVCGKWRSRTDQARATLAAAPGCGHPALKTGEGCSLLP
jgi:hypothetical protein